MRRQPPKYRKHANGQAFVCHRSFDTPGHRKYLGKHGSESSVKKYTEALKDIERWEQERQSKKQSVQLGQDSTIAEIVRAYLLRCETYYRDESGNNTAGLGMAIRAVGPNTPLIERFAAERGRDFGPLKLQAIRDDLINRGLARSTINRYVEEICRCFRWSVSQEIIPADVYQSIKSVSSLTKGRSKARETQPVQPVAWSDVERALPFFNPQLQAMVRVQYTCGMRPQDVCRLRGADIDRSGEIWIYRPPAHKNAWRGDKLAKAIPPSVQAILQPYIDEAGDGYLFVPQGKRHAHQLPAHYAWVIRDNFTRANAGGAGLTVWSPNQLRHGIATLVSSQIGIQAAQRWLGHKSLSTTQIYAEATDKELAAVARLVDELLKGQSGKE